MVAHPITHIELPSVDPRASARFYGELFGWHARRVEGNRFIPFEGAPGPSGAFAVIDGDHTRAGEVLLHIATDDIDATLGRVADAGGRTILPKTEVPGVVWYAIFADASGNRIGISTDLSPDAPPEAPGPTSHPIVFAEIPADEPRAAGEFYHAVFGWPMRHDPADNFTTCSIGPMMTTAFPQINDRRKAGQVMIFVLADDVDALLGKASALGGRVAVPRTEIPGVGWYGVFDEPSSTAIGLITLARRG